MFLFILIQDLLEAFEDDNFDCFREIVKSTRCVSRIKKLITRSTKQKTSFGENDCRTVIEKIVKSDFANSYQYLSYFLNNLKHFELNNSVKFWEEVRWPLILELLRNKSNNYELFFDYLMPDWHCPQIDEKLDYKLEEKIKRFNEAADYSAGIKNKSQTVFFEYIFHILSDSNQKFQIVCVRLLCQFLQEMLQNPEQLDVREIFLELFDRTSVIKKSALRTKLFEIILSVFLVMKKRMTPENEADIRIRLKQFETSKFSEMADLLERQQVVVFHETFKNFIAETVECYGDYSDAAIAHHVRLLVFIANNLKLALTVDVITRKFPFIGKNVTILTTLDELQIFNNFKVVPFRNGKFERMVR